jgi:hypothetical protein
MSLNYGTLTTQILADAHRPELTSKAADFVRQAEGVVARRLRCAEMMTRASFTETDRVSGGIYSLPTGWLQEGIIWNADGFPMDKVGLAAIRRYKSAMDTLLYCPLSSTEIEFRGVPGSGATFEQIYFARPAAFSNDGDTNAILTNHETIYLHAGMSALYTYTQDLELAAAASGVAEAAIETLNEQAGRLLAGAQAQGAYELSSFGSY